MKVKGIVSGLLIGSTIALVALIVFHAIKVRRSGGYAYSSDRSMFKKWNALAFTPINSSADFEAAVKSEAESQLAKSSWNTKQKQLLVGEIQSMFQAFSTGKYEDYEKFRFPTRRGKFDESRINSLLQSLKDYDPRFKLSTLDVSDTKFAWAVFEAFWKFSGIETNLYCAKCWKDVALRSLKIETFAETNVAVQLKNVLGQHKNVGINWWYSAFKFEPTLEEIAKSPEHADIAVVSVVIKSKVTTRVTKKTQSVPFYCLLYWIPDKQVWVPNEIGGSYSGFHKVLYLF